MDTNSYIQQISSIDAELSRLNTRMKSLREQKRGQMTGLYQLMKSQNLEYVGNGKNKITIRAAEPKLAHKEKIKPKSQRRLEEIEILRSQGIPNPEQLYIQLEETRRASGLPNKKQKKDIDPFLGF
jgi:hypothetical protein